MGEDETRDLSARERQIMDALFRRGEATVSEIREGLPDPPTASAVRTMLIRLEDKGHLKRKRQGNRNVYRPTISPAKARRSALDRLIDNFFEGSPARMVAAILDRTSGELDDEELERLQEMIAAERRRGR